MFVHSLMSILIQFGKDFLWLSEKNKKKFEGIYIVTVKTFIMLQKHFSSNKCCSLKLSIHQRKIIGFHKNIQQHHFCKSTDSKS